MTRARDFADVISGQFDLPAGSLDNAVPADGSITAAKLASNAVTTAKIAADAITSAKVADDAVTSDKIADNAIHGRRNLIINGAMQVAQRGTSFSANGYSLDRYKISSNNFDQLVFTVTQDSDSPDGFSNSLKYTTSTAETALDADEQFTIRYLIEAQDLQHLKFGTSNAQQTTLSFWVKSSEAATFTVFIYQADDSRMVTKPYTINSANTWEYKTITFPADTTGVIDNNNGEGFQISFGLGAGSDKKGGDTADVWSAYDQDEEQEGNDATILTTANATWQLTGVQLEVGDTATPFEHRSFGEELALCQRYFFKTTDTVQGGGLSVSTVSLDSICGVNESLPVTMRATPTLTMLGTTYRTGGTANAQKVTKTHITWGCKKTGSGTSNVGAYATGGFQVEAEL